jgi:hypothetical protein
VSRRRDSNPEPPDYKVGGHCLIRPYQQLYLRRRPHQVPETAPVDTISRHEACHARPIGVVCNDGSVDDELALRVPAGTTDEQIRSAVRAAAMALDLIRLPPP